MKSKYLRRVIFDEAITKGLLSVGLDRHPKPILFDYSNLTVNFPNNPFKFLKFLPRYNREIVNNDYVSEASIELQRILLKQILIVTISKL